MPQRKSCRTYKIAYSLTPFIAGAVCAGQPLPAVVLAQQSPAQSPAAQSTMGVQVKILDRDDWPGPANITRELTPVKVRIQNDGTRATLLTYDRFKLTDTAGRTYRALPLFKVEGTDVLSLKVRDPYRLGTQHFVLKNFNIAPYYEGIYHGVDVYQGNFAAHPTYYQLYDNYYSGKPLPTTVMRRHGIPEGVILPGGSAEGFLFFEEVKDSDGAVVTYEATDAATGLPLGQVRSSG